MRCHLPAGWFAVVFSAFACVVASGIAADWARADGPEVGKAVPALKIQAMTSDGNFEEADGATAAAGKPVVYLLVQHSKWDRPIARFLKVLDDKIRDNSATAVAYGVFLSSVVEQVKEYLPKVNQSLKFQHMTLGSYTDDGTGPADWNVSGDAGLTVAVAYQGKITATFSYVSTNETDVPAVLEAVKKAVDDE
jgi:hypothetical protein